MKQTAVEWLQEVGLMKEGKLTIRDFELAISLEKQQIENAYIDGLWDCAVPLFTTYQAEKYYNETFNDDNKQQKQQ